VVKKIFEDWWKRGWAYICQGRNRKMLTFGQDVCKGEKAGA